VREAGGGAVVPEVAAKLDAIASEPSSHAFAAQAIGQFTGRISTASELCARSEQEAAEDAAAEVRAAREREIASGVRTLRALFETALRDAADCETCAVFGLMLLALRFVVERGAVPSIADISSPETAAWLEAVNAVMSDAPSKARGRKPAHRSIEEEQAQARAAALIGLCGFRASSVRSTRRTRRPRRVAN
jgi:hypothetical protein